MDEADNNLEDYTWTISDRYVVMDRIGTGGMAEIFRAKMFGAAGFEKEFAIKLIRPHLLNDEEFVEMFVNEAKLSVALYHTNIVQVFDFGLYNDRYYIVMEYVEGKDLLDILARCVNNNIRIPLDIGLHIVMELLKGLDFAHRATDVTTGESLNIIHRDISPSNILVSYTGGIKVGDFGVAKARLKQSMSRTGTLKGKVGYMSPEQVIGDPIDYRSDIFAAGIILFETISMSRLFRAENDFGTMLKVRDCDIDTALERIQALPSGLERILRTALSRDVNERYQTAGAFFQELSAFAYDNRLIVDNTRVSNLMRRLFASDIERQKKKRHAENQSLKVMKSTQTPSPKPSVALPKSSDSVLDLPDIPSHGESSDGRIEALGYEEGHHAEIDTSDIVRAEAAARQTEEPEPQAAETNGIRVPQAAGKLNDLLSKRNAPRSQRTPSPVQPPPQRVPAAPVPNPAPEPLTFDDVTRIKSPQDVLVPEQAIVAGFVDEEVTQPPSDEVIAPPPQTPSSHVATINHEHPIETPRLGTPSVAASPTPTPPPPNPAKVAAPKVARPTLDKPLKHKLKSKAKAKDKEPPKLPDPEPPKVVEKGTFSPMPVQEESEPQNLHEIPPSPISIAQNLPIGNGPQDTIVENHSPAQPHRLTEAPFAHSPLRAFRPSPKHGFFEKSHQETPPPSFRDEQNHTEEQALKTLLLPYEQKDFFFRDSDGRILGPLQGNQLYYFLTSDRAGDISFDSVLWESISDFAKSIERKEGDEPTFTDEPTFSEEEPLFEGDSDDHADSADILLDEAFGDEEDIPTDLSGETDQTERANFTEVNDTREEERSPTVQPTEGDPLRSRPTGITPPPPRVPDFGSRRMSSEESPSETEENDRRRDAAIVPPPPKVGAAPPPPFGQLHRKRPRRPTAIDAFEKMMAAASELEELSSEAGYDSSVSHEEYDPRKAAASSPSLPVVNSRHRSDSGRLSEISCTRLLFRLLKNHQTGRLILSRNVPAGDYGETIEVKKEFYFEKGRPVSALSNLDQERLGDFLIERNLITQDQLNAALERTKKWGGRLGDSLVANNAISSQQIVNYLRMQFEEKILEVFEWDDGDYHFFENQVTTERNYLLDLDLFRIISEGCLSRIPFDYIADTYRSRMHCSLILTPNFESGLEHFKLGPPAIRILRAYNTGDTLEMIKHRTPPNKLELSARVFYLMHQVEYIVLSDENSPT